jgi:ribosomal protein S18 acetylase RimI-like enzyme
MVLERELIIQRATGAEAACITETLADAFASDPILNWVVRNDTQRAKAMVRLFQWAVKRGFDFGHVDQIADCSAAAVWLRPPGIEATGLIKELSLLPAMVEIMGLGGLAKGNALQKAMAVHHPKASHWYLAFLGVRPSRQGQGLGSRLLKHHLTRVDAERAAAYLETGSDDNIRLYQRHGFEVVSTFTPQMPADPTVPTVYGMWRDARSASS